MNRFLDRPRALWQILGLVWLICLLLMGFRLRMDNSPEIWLPTGDAEVEYYDRFRAHFGNDSFVGVVASKKDGFAIQAALEQLSEVVSPYDENGGFKSDPMSRRLLSKDNVALLLTVPEDVKPKAFLTQVDERVGELPLVGTEIVTRALDAGSERSFGGLFPLVALVLSAVVYASLRSTRMVVATFLAATTAAVAALACMAAVGHRLNLLVVLMPAILIVLTVAASVHLCHRARVLAEDYGQDSQDDRNKLWKQAAEDTWKPCLLATLTTALGFGSLAVSEVGPVSDLGLFTGVGAIFVLIAVFSVVPAFVSRNLISPAPAQSEELLGSYVSKLKKLRIPILAVGVSLFVLTSAGVPRLQVESNVMEFFQDGHEVPQAYADFEREFFGLTSFEVVLDGPLAQVVKPEVFEALNKLEREAVKKGIVTSASSPWLSDGERSAAENGMLVMKLLQDVPEDSKAYFWRGGSTAALRVTFSAPTTSSNAAFEAVQELRELMGQAKLPKQISLRVSGAAPLLVRGQVLLLDTQIRSFAVAILLITGVITLGYRSFRLSALSLLCNVLPITGTLGLMGWLQIPLNAGTVTVAGIALGLIVDDTIHIIHGISETGDEDSMGQVKSALLEAGRPILITTLALALGFGLFSIADFQPTRYFGLLTAVTAGLAAFADLVLLPALLLHGK